MGGTQWTFYMKDNKTFYFDSFGGNLINFYLTNNQNLSFFKIMEFKLSIVDYAVRIARTFPI